MKQCPRCLTPAEDNYQVCMRCGYRFDSAENQPPNSGAQDQGQYAAGQGQYTAGQGQYTAGQTPPPPPPYPGYPVYSTYPDYLQPKYNGLSIAALVLGIIGLVSCGVGIVPSVLALIFGVVSKGQIANSMGAQRGKEFATAGFIMGIIGLALAVVVIIYYFAVLSATTSFLSSFSNSVSGNEAMVRAVVPFIF